MSEPMQEPGIEGAKALRHVTRFRCIGPQCEDSCCVGWQILIDNEHYDRLRDAFSTGSDDRALFRESVERFPPERRTSSCFARMRYRQGTRCAFLRDDALCTVQARFGEALLPSGCAVYPRSIALIGRRFEVSASLSCPEAARLCLLDDGANDLVDATPDALPRFDIQQHVELRDEKPYALAFECVREALLAILGIERRELWARLALIAWLGRNTASFVHEKATDIDPLKLTLEIERVAMAPLQAAFLRELSATERSLAPPMSLVLQLLRQRLGDAAAPRLRALISGILQSLSIEAERLGASGVDGLLAAFAARRERLFARHGARVDTLLTRWAVNHVWQEPWVRSPDLFVHARKLIVRTAVIRFLVIGHPALAADEPVAEAVLDATVVDVVQRFSRAVEHDADFLTSLDQSLDDGPGANLIDVLGLLVL